MERASALPAPDEGRPLDSFRGRLLDGVWSLAMGISSNPPASERRCAANIGFIADAARGNYMESLAMGDLNCLSASHRQSSA